MQRSFRVRRIRIMPKNEDGEFELVLGNRQLLMVFFIVVVLLGVFFTMGFIVGKNSAPEAARVPASGRTADREAPIVVDPPARAKEVAPTSSKEEPAKEEPEVKKALPKEEPKATPPAKEPPPAPARTASSAGTPKPGTYLQLAATTQREAEVMVDVLRRKSFSALVAAVPDKPGSFRVLVGPIAEGQINKTKTDLQNSGFPGNNSIRRVY